jgi:hypothetical protein
LITFAVETMLLKSQRSMKGEVFSEVAYSKNVIEFATVANEFCAFVESVDNYKRKDFIVRIQKLLPLLYLKASLLPATDEDLSDETPEKFVTENDYNFIHRKLLSKFGQNDTYQEVFDQRMQYSEIPVDGSIAENIADIYQDLKDFILSYRIGTIDVMTNALWECRNNFEQYWGQRLVNGLRAIHNLVYGEADLDEERETPVKFLSDDEDQESPDIIMKQQFRNFRE